MTDREENQPQPDGNGDMTLAFFDQAFGMNGREGLALMGAHTIGQFHSLVISDNKYGWLQPDHQNRLWNNKYYKVLYIKYKSDVFYISILMDGTKHQIIGPC